MSDAAYAGSAVTWCFRYFRTRDVLAVSDTTSAMKTHCSHGHDLREVGVYSRGQCAECGRIAGRKYFMANRASANGASKRYYHKHRSELLARNKVWRDENDWSSTSKSRKYGLAAAEVKEMLKRGCDICGSLHRREIDHDHTTGRVRGVLCARCNRGLGFFDSLQVLQTVMDYLRAAGRQFVVSAEDQANCATA